MNVGVLGGSFDPIHFGHLVAAEEVRYRLQLPEVLFVPAGEPPHKLFRPMSSVEHRVAMVNLAIRSNPYFKLSRIDIDRPGPHFTVDTVALLQQELGPDAEIYFIVGLDSLLEMGTWREPERLLRICRIVGVTRPGYEDVAKVPDEILQAGKDRVLIIPIPEMGISSSNLRQRVRDGKPIKYQLPETVEDYVYKNGLYV